MPKDIYLILHIAGIILTVQALAVASFLAFKGDIHANEKAPKIIHIVHGVGLFLVILGGFGMIAKLGIGFPWPGWLWVKLGVWVVFGGATVVIRKYPDSGRAWFFMITALVVLAAAMAILKPF